MRTVCVLHLNKMKKSIPIIISLVGIFVVGISGMLYEQHRSTLTLTNVPDYVVDTNASIEFSELKPMYVLGQPIKFSILAHKFSGCSQVHLMIFDKLKTPPPIYEKYFYPPCTEDSKIKPDEYSFSVDIKSLNSTQADTYVVVAEYYQDRASYGDIEQRFHTGKLAQRIKTDQYLLEISNLQGNYVQNEEISFDVHEKGFDIRCFSVYAEIYDSSGNRIWEQSSVVECPPGLGKSNFDYKVPFSGIKIDKPGKYTLVVQSRGHEISRTFSILDENLVR